MKGFFIMKKLISFLLFIFLSLPCFASLMKYGDGAFVSDNFKLKNNNLTFSVIYMPNSPDVKKLKYEKNISDLYFIIMTVNINCNTGVGNYTYSFLNNKREDVIPIKYRKRDDSYSKNSAKAVCDEVKNNKK